MEKTILRKENGEVRIIESTPEVEKNLIEIKNPCFGCRNGYVTKCPKMADEIKKPIGEYEYITDGYQVLDENGNTESLVIAKCSNFENDVVKPKAKTKEEIEKLKRKKESLLILYYGGENVQEALQTQADIERRERLREIREEALIENKKTR